MSKHSNKFSMEEVMVFWDRVANEYDHANAKVDRLHTQRFRGALKRLKLRPGMRILNVWSRIGEAISYLRSATKDIEIVNAELSLEMLKQARAIFDSELFVQTSLHEFPFRDSCFDAVLSLETLEHVPDPILFLEETRRVLKDNGQLVMSLPPSAVEWTSILNNILKFHHGEGPHRFLSPREVKEMLRETGFQLLEHRGTLFFPISGDFSEFIDCVLGDLFKDGPFAQFGLRQFYVCKASR